MLGSAIGVALVLTQVWLGGGQRPRAHDGRFAMSMDRPGENHEALRNLVGFKTGVIAELDAEVAPGDAVSQAAGLFFERSVVPGWLELEINLPIAVDPRGRHLRLPLDAYVKKPFHPSARVGPYVGVGPVVDLLLHPERRVRVGGSVTVGTYVWAGDRVGVDVEIAYDLVADDGRAVHELVAALGPVLRF